MFKDYIIMNVSQATVKVLSAITLLLLNISDPLIAFITYASCPIFGCIYGIIVMPTWIVSKIKPTTAQYQAINKVLKYTSIAIIVGAISDNIDVLMVKSFLSNYETGLYSAGARLSMLVSLFGYSLSTVLNPRVSRYQSKDHFKKYVPKALLISAIALIGTVISIPLAKPLLLITAGGEYLEAITTVKYLLAAGFVVLATTPFVSMFYVLDKTQYFAIRGVIQMIVLITTNLLLIPQFGIVGAGMARLITRITAFMFTAIYAGFAVRQQYKINFAKEIREIKNI
jgi:O-antigen/teichoic acid export membrane protein